MTTVLLLPAPEPPYSKITERGIKQGKYYFESPVGDNKGENERNIVLISHFIKGDEFKDRCIHELAYYRSQIVSYPEVFALCKSADSAEKENIEFLAYCKTYKTGKCHSHGRREYKLVLGLIVPGRIRRKLYTQSSYGKVESQENN